MSEVEGPEEDADAVQNVEPVHLRPGPGPHNGCGKTTNPECQNVGDRYRGASLTRKCTPLGSYRRPMLKVLRGS